MTGQGADVARQAAAGLGGRVCVPERLAAEGEQGFASFGEAVARYWPTARGHVFVAATGIVVRCIAPLLRHKADDPAVVVCDQAGRFAISLLSGHLGGANALAERVAACLGGQAVITTATDSAGLPAFDVLARDAGCAFADIHEVKAVSAALLDGSPVAVHDPLGVLDARAVAACPYCLPLSGRFADVAQAVRAALSPEAPEREPGGAAVCVSLAPLTSAPGRLRLHPRRVAVGVGCRKGVDGKALVRAVLAALDGAGCSPLAVACLASAELKSEEPGLHEAARALGVPLHFFSAERLAAYEVPSPSAKAAEVLAVERVGVCEGAALCAAGERGVLFAPKARFDAAGAPRVDGPGAITVALAYGPAYSAVPPCVGLADNR